MEKGRKLTPAKHKENAAEAENANRPNNPKNKSPQSIRILDRTNLSQTTKLKTNGHKLALGGSFPIRPTRSVSSVHEEPNSETSAFKDVALPDFDKNEAEIIDDYSVTPRRGSLPALGNDKSAHGFAFPGAAITSFPKESHFRRAGSISDSVDRELQCLYKNHIEDIRLQHTFSKLERQSFAGILEHKHKISQAFKEYKKLIQKSPSADEWLSMQKPRMNAVQERDKDAISRASRDQTRHFKISLHLENGISESKLHAATDGYPQQQHSDNSSDEDDDHTVQEKMAAIGKARRHTISDLVTDLSRFNKGYNTTKRTMSPNYRTSMTDKKTADDVSELKPDHKESKHDDAYKTKVRPIDEQQRNLEIRLGRTGNYANSGSNGGNWRTSSRRRGSLPTI